MKRIKLEFIQKYCDDCGEPIIKRADEQISNYRRRVYCGDDCRLKNDSINRNSWFIKKNLT